MASDGLTIAVTGPTGDLGIATVSALERSRKVRRIVGLARRAFDPASERWRKTEYRQGDIRDKASVRDAVRGADVVVHLAFAIIGAGAASWEVNVEGSRQVFEAAIEAGVERICYSSSVAAYGFHRDNPDWLDENVPARGSPDFYYSREKAEVEAILNRLLLSAPRTQGYVYRPSIVAGPRAQMLLEQMPYFQLGDRLPDAVVRLLSSLPVLKPVIPDAGTPFQLVHEDDVASALVAGALGRGEPGPYNLAARGTLTLSDVADALGWYSVPMPETALDATAEIVSRVPSLPEAFAWVQAFRKPVLMKTGRAQKELRWRPKHTARKTLEQLVSAYREERRV